MEDNNLFYKVICCGPILKKILSYLSMEDCCDFSKVCKTTFKELKNIKMGRVVTIGKWNYEYNALLNITYPMNFEFAKIKGTEYLTGDVYTDNPKAIKKLVMSVEFKTHFSSNRQAIKKTGQEINKYLKKLPNIRELSLYMNRYFLGDCLVEDFMKEITNDKITTLKIGYRCISYSNDAHLINDARILRGFSNLKIFSSTNVDINFDNIDVQLFNIMSQKKELIFNLNVEIVNKFTGVNSRKRIIFHNGGKQLKLAVYIKYDPEFGKLVTYLDTSGLFLIHILSLRVNSIEELRTFSSYLKCMTNLKYLTIKLDLSESDPQILNSDYVQKNFPYKPFKNLMKLKYISIQGYGCDRQLFSYNNEESLLNEYYRGAEFLKREISSFLCNGPSSVETLRFKELPELTNKMTFLLDKVFPNLIFLHLESIAKVDKDCVMEFNNLQIFESYNMDILDIPKTVNVCVVSLDRSIRKREKFDVCSKYYKDLKIYKKELTIENYQFYKIFFNEFQNYFNYEYYGFFKEPL